MIAVLRRALLFDRSNRHSTVTLMAKFSSSPLRIPIVTVRRLNKLKQSTGVENGDRVSITWNDELSTSTEQLAQSSTGGILSVLTAIERVLNEAMYERHFNHILIRVDHEYVERAINQYLSAWRRRGFTKADGEPIKYLEQFKNIDALLMQVKANVQFSAPEKNAQNSVPKTNTSIVLNEVGSIIYSSENESTDYWDTAPIVYVSGMSRQTSHKKGTFATVGIGIKWSVADGSDPQLFSDVSERINLIFTTDFRIRFSAILLALQKAVDLKLERLVIVTNCPVFFHWYRKGWKKANGETVGNLDLYQRSVKLLEKVKVKFICATEKTEPNLVQSMELANFATSLPMVQPRVTGTVNEKPIVEDQPGWTRVRIIVNRVEINGTTSFAYSITWSGDQSPVDIQGDWPSDSVGYAGILKTVLKALEMARDNGLKHLVVQTTSAGLVRTLSEWLPKWRKKQWKTSLGKPVKHEQLYRQIDDCLQDIEVKWEHQAAFTPKPTEPFDFDADLDYFMPVTMSMT